MSENFIKYVELRLQEWADWFSRGNLYGVGFPSCSIEHRLMTDAIITRSKGPKPLPCNKEVEEIESLVCEMAQQNKIMAQVLCHYYLNQGSLRDKTKLYCMHRDRYKSYVDMAHQWLAGRLSAFYG